MSNNFTIAVTATDKFSVTFGALQKQATTAATTMRRLGAQQSKDAEAVERSANKARKAVSAAGQEITDNIGLGGGLLGTMFRMGGAGGVFAGAAAAVAGIALITKSWSEYGTEVMRTSSLLGVSTTMLQTWREAAKLAGGTAEGMTASLSALGNTLQGAAFGRNPVAAMVMGWYGIKTARDKNGAIDVSATMQGVAAVAQRLKGDPLKLNTFIQALGLPPEAAYTLGHNYAGNYFGRALGTGVVMKPDRLARARQMDATITEAAQTLRAAGYSVSDIIAPNTDEQNAASRKATADEFARRRAEREAERERSDNFGLKPPGPAASAPTVQIDVNIPNAPPGTTVRARSPDNVPVKIGNTDGIAK